MSVDLSDLISRKEVIAAVLYALREVQPAFKPEEKSAPRSSNPEDILAWEHERGKPWKDRHHL